MELSKPPGHVFILCEFSLYKYEGLVFIGNTHICCSKLFCYIVTEGKVKTSRPNLRETRDQGPGEELMSQSHYEYDKAFLVAAPGFIHSYAAADGHGAMGCNQRIFIILVVSAPVRVPTQRLLVPSFASVVG